MIAKIFFETFNVPGLFILDRPLAMLYGSGSQLLTGIVLDVGLDSIGTVFG